MTQPDSVPGPEPEEAVTLPPFIIEGARSSRSRCKTCRKNIQKDELRLGILVEGPYGAGHMWHHLTCAARNRFDDVEAAYAAEAWLAAKETPDELPELEELRSLREQAEKKKSTKKELPYAELDPSGRAKCKHSGEPMAKGELRVVLGRAVEFGSQTRTQPITVLPQFVADALAAEDSATEIDGFFEALRANSADLDDAQLDELEALIGELR